MLFRKDLYEKEDVRTFKKLVEDLCGNALLLWGWGRILGFLDAWFTPLVTLSG